MPKRVLMFLVVALLVTIFALMNAGVVVVKLPFYSFEMSMAIVIIGSFTLGALFMFLVNLVGWVKQKHTINELKNQVKHLEKVEVEVELPLENTTLEQQ